MTPTITPLFSVPFATVHMEEPGPLCEELTRLFLQKEASGDRYRNDIRRDTQVGLFESRFDLHTWPDPPVRTLFDFIHRSLAATIQQLSGYTAEEYAALEFHYHTWFHVTRQGGHQGTHNHPMASWSGIFCVDPGDSPEDRPQSGVVRFMDPRPGAEMYLDAGNERLRGQFHQGGFEFRHRRGQLVLFPSYVYHEVFPYWGTQPRIVVAFNAWLQLRSPAAGGR